MNNKQRKSQNLLEEVSGLKKSDDSPFVYGEIKGYNVIINAGHSSIDSFYDVDELIFRRNSRTTVMFSITSPFGEITKDQIKELKKELGYMYEVYLDENLLQVVCKHFRKSSKRQRLCHILDIVPKYLEKNKFVNCCMVIKSTENIAMAVVEGRFSFLEEKLIQEKVLETNYKLEENKNSPINYFKGILGMTIAGFISYLVLIIVGKWIGFLDFGYLAYGGLITVGYYFGAKRINIFGMISILLFIVSSIVITEKIEFRNFVDFESNEYRTIFIIILIVNIIIAMYIAKIINDESKKELTTYKID